MSVCLNDISKGNAMKILVFSIIVGSVMLYFFNIALLKTPLLDLDWSFHAALRFSAGFFILGVSYFYAKALTFKNALTITACILKSQRIRKMWMLHQVE